MKYEKHLIKEVILNAKLKDLNPVFFGYVIEFSGKRIGPCTWNSVTARYVEEGRAIFEIGNQVYEVLPGDVFIDPIGVTTTIHVKEDLKIKYIGFDGDLSRDFLTLPPVFKSSGKIFDEIVSAASYKGRMDVLISSILMRWYTELFPKSEPITNDNILRAKEYIDENYMYPIKVSEIAKMLNMNRSYFSRIFKEKIGQTVQDYLITVRLKEARHLLNKGKNVTEAAFLCGFSGQSHFSKTYRKYYPDLPKNQKNLKIDV